ncbi:uncharacterized protein [Triticum aestivum]|uniref:uncharacterized protein n=1 Tax=Triticum aestivum TaxID=4565 RepID=UPI001D01D7E2|nr:uncharacterized protein LOC123191143 [Triticum aestivum]
MDLGKSSSIISEQEIKELCAQMDEMVAFMNYRIIPSAPLICSSSNGTKDEEDKAPQSPGIDGILQRLADMRRDMSKLKSELAPFWHEYPYEKKSELTPEEREKRIKSWHEYEKLDNKDKASKEMEFDVDDFEGYCQGMTALVEHFRYTSKIYMANTTRRDRPHTILLPTRSHCRSSPSKLPTSIWTCNGHSWNGHSKCTASSLHETVWIADAIFSSYGKGTISKRSPKKNPSCA